MCVLSVLFHCSVERHGLVILGIPCVTDCVMAELEKLGQRYRIALRYAQSLTHYDSAKTVSVLLVIPALSAYHVHIQEPMQMIVWSNE
jgi:rRNA-processing protein FCF1